MARTVVVVLPHYQNVSLRGEDPSRKYTSCDCVVVRDVRGKVARDTGSFVNRVLK